MWPNFVNGFKCFAGHNSVRNDTTMELDWTMDLGNSSHTPHVPPDDCGHAPGFVSAYMVFNIAYNLFIVRRVPPAGISRLTWWLHPHRFLC